MLRNLKRIKVYVVEHKGRDNLRLMYRDPVTGRQVFRTTTTTKRREAERAAALLEEEVNANRQNYGGVSWEWLRVKFTDEHLATKSVTTIENFSHALNRFERDLGKPTDIREITGVVLSGWQRRLAASGLAPASVATNLRCVRVVLNWAAKIGLIQHVPQIIMPRAGQSRGRPITLLEFVRLLREIPKVFPDHAKEATSLVKGLWLSGLRLDEAMRLSWPDGAGESIPVVELEGRKYPAIRWPIKSHKSRLAVLTPMPRDLARFLSRTPASERTGLVFRVPLARKTIGKRISAAGKASQVSVGGTKHVTAHDLRRTFGNRWALRVHPLVLRMMMRHTAMETTLRYYVDLQLDQVGEALWATTAANGNQIGNQTEHRKTGERFSSMKKRGK